MINVIIPAAGEGSRFKGIYDLPKPLIPVNGEPMISLAIRSLGISARYFVLLRNDQYLEAATSAVKSVIPDAVILTISETTQGPAASGLLFETYIDADEELIIANCDQVMLWDADVALEKFRTYDGAVVTYTSNDPKNSFANIKDGLVNRIVEKQPISDCALVGVHYWHKAKYFFDSAKDMIDDRYKTNNEYYIGPTYNYLVRNDLRIGYVNLHQKEFYLIGTPADLEEYLNDRE